MRLGGILIVVVLAGSACLLAAADTEQAKIRKELAGLGAQLDVVERAFVLANQLNEPSVVAIHTHERTHVLPRRIDGWGRTWLREIPVGDGSGFIFYSDERGSAILTNAHVVVHTDQQQKFMQDARTRKPLWHGRIEIESKTLGRVPARPLGADLDTDLAVIWVEKPNLPIVRWGDSDAMRTGHSVMALGYPFGRQYTATFGRIGGTAQQIKDHDRHELFDSFLQTDADINPGNSGGPVINLRGEVIGVSAITYSPDRKHVGSVGLGYAIPSNLAKQVADDLRQYGDVNRPVVGLKVYKFSEQEIEALQLPNRNAAKVTRVLPASPAAEMGIQIGDAIVAVDGKELSSVQEFRTRIASKSIGTDLHLDIWRAGKRLKKSLRPISAGDLEERWRKLAHNRVIWPGFGLELKRDQARRGLLIDKVHIDGPGARAGLVAGDRILRIQNRDRRILDMDSIRDLDKEKTLVLEVYHQGRLYLVRLRK